MSNWTQLTHFSLEAYSELGPLRWLYLLLCASAYVLILGSNALLIAVIVARRSLHTPMYMFLCSLFVNELWGSTTLFPFLMFQLLRDEHDVSFSLCFLQIFCLYQYACVEIFTLAAMSYDRYIAICKPLHYHRMMGRTQVALLLGLTWLAPAAAICVLLWLSASLPLCGNIIDKVYCGNYSIVKLACSSTRINNVYGLLYTVVSMMLPLAFIFYSYGCILRVGLSRDVSAPGQTRHKALSTCAPHLASVLNFSFGCCSQVVMSRFDVSRLPSTLSVLLSLYFFTCPPLFNPLMYGLQLAQIRAQCKGLLKGQRP